MNSKTRFWLIFLFLILIGVAIWALSAGQINIISDAENADVVKRRQAETRLKELEAELQMDKAVKKRLDRFVVWGFVLAKIVVLGLLFSLCLVVKFLLHLSWTTLYELQEKALTFIGACTFVLLGAEIKLIRIYPWLRDLVKAWVYRKYGHLEPKIQAQEDEIEQLKHTIAELDQTVQPQPIPLESIQKKVQ